MVMFIPDVKFLDKLSHFIATLIIERRSLRSIKASGRKERMTNCVFPVGTR